VFKNILVPTDGSEMSCKAAQKAVTLAKSMGARVTGFHVAPEYHPQANDDYYIPRNYLSPTQFAAKTKEVADRHLDAVTKAATAGAVQCDAHYVNSDFPADAIVKAAKKYKCDAIVMASHGRTGLSRFFLGSQTQKVIAATKLPVVVLRI
jgi:Universal stress protein UspA and related nucleotide-binding proteins